jgi:anti-sigma regulatory factor (Ser/Thr protein kinase)
VRDVEVLRDPTPEQVRDVLRDLRGDDDARPGDDLALAVSEVVANAHRHGRPPVEVRVAVVDGDVEVVVHDAGPGPRDAGAPGLPTVDAVDGRGRWLAHHLADVVERRTTSGYEVRLRRSTGGGASGGES